MHRLALPSWACLAAADAAAAAAAVAPVAAADGAVAPVAAVVAPVAAAVAPVAAAVAPVAVGALAGISVAALDVPGAGAAGKAGFKGVCGEWAGDRNCSLNLGRRARL